MNSKTNGDIFALTKSDQYKAVDDLIEEGRADTFYYMLLILSSVIIASGVLLANSAILIGGMLVTPVLTPVLLISLGIVTGKPALIRHTAVLIGKSVLIIFAVSLAFGVVFDVPTDTEFFDNTIFNNTLNAAALYFIVALASGIAATFSWIRKELSSMVSGISIAVSLVPPISLVAVWLATGHFDDARFFLLVFLFNMIGIIVGSMIVFSMLHFYRIGSKVEKKVNQVIEEEEKKKAEAEKEKKESEKKEASDDTDTE